MTHTNPTNLTNPTARTARAMSGFDEMTAWRRAVIDGLVELAAFLEANPGVPVHRHGWDLSFHTGLSTDITGDQAARDEITRIAALLAVATEDRTGDGGHLTATKTFGPISYTAVHIPAAHMTRRAAEDSYRTNIATTLDTTTATPADSERGEQGRAA